MGSKRSLSSSSRHGTFRSEGLQPRAICRESSRARVTIRSTAPDRCAASSPTRSKPRVGRALLSGDIHDGATIILDAKDGELVVKVNVDENPGIASRYGAMSIPLLVLIEHGREVDRQVGAVPEAKLVNWLKPRLAERHSSTWDNRCFRPIVRDRRS
jgi:hypothetical protein